MHCRKTMLLAELVIPPAAAAKFNPVRSAEVTGLYTRIWTDIPK